jgi:hypothetical protein
LLHFRVVLCLDFYVVEEILFLTFMLDELEAMAIKGVFILIPSDVMDGDALRGVRALKSVCLTVVWSQKEIQLYSNKTYPT